MGSINKVTLIGNLGNDPEVRQLDDGALIVTLSIATSEKWKDKQTGEKRERTEWHRVIIFNQGLAKIARDYLKKGAPVYIEGKLQTRKWTTGEGQERYITEVTLQSYNGVLQMLGKASSHDRPTSGDEAENSTNNTSSGFGNGGYQSGDLDDEIPF